jgi:hypothetical protein
VTYSLTWLPSVLKKAGLKVVEEKGWQTRGRGDIGKVKFVLCHHTATQQPSNAPSLWIVRDGRPDVPGPLSQLVLGRDGTYYVVAAGKANHAGKGEWRGMVDSGNRHSIGIEAENNGVGEPWPEKQMVAYAEGVAAILKHLGLTANECVGHKEYAPKRKIDPNFDMNAFRQRVAAAMGGVKPASVPPAPAPAPAAPPARALSAAPAPVAAAPAPAKPVSPAPAAAPAPQASVATPARAPVVSDAPKPVPPTTLVEKPKGLIAVIGVAVVAGLAGLAYLAEWFRSL